MESLAFELGFDLDVNPVLGVRDGVFPLQLALVNDDVNGDPPEPAVISPFDPSVVHMGDSLSFRVYDFSDPAAAVPPEPSLCALQILFTSATSESVPISPFEIGGATRPQLATTNLELLPSPVSSVAFGDKVRFGWEAKWDVSPASPPVPALDLDNDGRFKFRALLTVGIPNQMAMFYRSDPEMVVGDPAGGA